MSKNIHLEANFWVQQPSTVATEAKMVSCYLLPPSARPAFFFCIAPSVPAYHSFGHTPFFNRFESLLL